MCLAQGPQRSDISEARTCGPSVSSHIPHRWKYHVTAQIKPLAYMLEHSYLPLCLLGVITFANSLEPDQDRQNVGSDLDANCLTL